MTPAVLSRRALRDLTAAARWIAQDNPAAARAMRAAVAQAGDRIGAHRQIGRKRPELIDRPWRYLAISGFPYVIVYDDERDPPVILRILHGARDLPEALKEH